jgi:pyrimidine operon attenuation protein / uracil phosphoribosyltransferase
MRRAYTAHVAQNPFLLADRRRVEALLNLLATRVAGTAGDDFALVGVVRRGEVIARELGARLERLLEHAVPVGEVRLERYADDLTVVHRETRLEARELPFAVEGARLVLIDDVLYSGRSLLRAAQHFLDRGAAEVRVTVLVDRGGREVPLAADAAAVRLEVGPAHQVEVHVPPYEDDWAVWIRERGRTSGGPASA